MSRNDYLCRVEKGLQILAFRGGELLVKAEGDGRFALPDAKDYPDGCDEAEAFRFDRSIAFETQGGELPGGLEFRELRSCYSGLSATDYSLAAKARELLHWNGTMRRCPRCGVELRRSGPISKTCGECGAEYFPQLSPAVLVLVRRGREALLVHARNFRRNFFGLVAGFVETGESLEECVRREVIEETSLQIRNIRYFGSQTWPFPAQLMIGFTADYESGEVQFADGELSAGGFFSPENPPQLPTPPSLARTMIDAWLRETIGEDIFKVNKG